MTLPLSHKARKSPGLPWPLLVLLGLNIVPELVLQLADRGWFLPVYLRPLVYALGAFQPDLIAARGPIFPAQPLTIFFTYGFLHVGLSHLAINMLALIWLGRLILSYRSAETFVTLYLMCMIGAAELFALISPPGATMVGASGALFGLMGLYAVDTGLLVPIQRSLGAQILIIAAATLLVILSDIISSLILGSVVAWQAHTGGFLTGAVFALIYPPRRRQNS